MIAIAEMAAAHNQGVFASSPKRLRCRSIVRPSGSVAIRLMTGLFEWSHWKRCSQARSLAAEAAALARTGSGVAGVADRS